MWHFYRSKKSILCNATSELVIFSTFLFLKGTVCNNIQAVLLRLAAVNRPASLVITLCATRRYSESNCLQAKKGCEEKCWTSLPQLCLPFYVKLHISLCDQLIWLIIVACCSERVKHTVPFRLMMFLLNQVLNEECDLFSVSLLLMQ